jgi:SagB-type dehydrogenase family enzyme
LTRRIVSAEPQALGVLGFFEDWRPAAELAAELPDFQPASLARAVGTLVEHTLLLREGSPEAERDERLASEWRHWLPQASFHFSTRDAPFASPRQWRKMARGLFAESPQPPIFKADPGKRRTPLPPPAAGGRGFLDTLLARRTSREFSGEAVALDRISALLKYTWGTTGDLQSPNFGRLLLKTSPSGGARHPGEVYLAAFDVAGLAPGLYHYDVRDHALAELRRGQLRDRLEELAVGQRHVGRAAAVFVMTALWPRSMWKYRTPRAYRVVTLDAGHLGQTFCLVATWLGLAPFTTAALRDSGIEELLGIDGITESVLYLAGVGMPRNRRAARSSSPDAAGRRRARATKRRRPPRA